MSAQNDESGGKEWGSLGDSAAELYKRAVGLGVPLAALLADPTLQVRRNPIPPLRAELVDQPDHHIVLLQCSSVHMGKGV